MEIRFNEQRNESINICLFSNLRGDVLNNNQMASYEDMLKRF